MVNKRKERPCDSVPADRRCRVCCNPRYKMPCQGPLPETSEAEPGGSSEAEPTSAATTRSGRIVVEPTRLAEDAAYVEQLGSLRDLCEQLCKEPDHVTKDAQIEALTAEVSELHEQATKLHDALRTLMATHSSKRSTASSSLRRGRQRSCSTRRSAGPKWRGRRRSRAPSSHPPKPRRQRWRWRRPPRRPLPATLWSR
jgi:hypothetical protein